MEVFYIIIGIYLVCGIIFNVVRHKAAKKKEHKYNVIRAEREKSRQAWIDKCAKEKEKNIQKSAPKEKFGVIVRRFYPGVTLYKNGITINNKDFELSEIIGVQITDPRGEWAKQLGLSGDKISTSTKSAVGRAVVGGLIAGPVGAIVGGATAKKTVEKVSYGHNYVVKIFTLNNRYSTVDVVVGENYNKAMELKAIVDSIISNNRN